MIYGRRHVFLFNSLKAPNTGLAVKVADVFLVVSISRRLINQAPPLKNPGLKKYM